MCDSPRTGCAWRVTPIYRWREQATIEWSLLLLAATVWSFAHLPLGLSDRNRGFHYKRENISVVPRWQKGYRALFYLRKHNQIHTLGASHGEAHFRFFTKLKDFKYALWSEKYGIAWRTDAHNILNFSSVKFTGFNAIFDMIQKIVWPTYEVVTFGTTPIAATVAEH